MTTLKLRFTSRVLGTLLALFTTVQVASAYYDPGTQRWLNRDPIADRAALLPPRDTSDGLTWKSGMPGPHHYLFVRNDPLSFVDALGLTDGNPFVLPEDDPSFQLGMCISIAKRRLKEYNALVNNRGAVTGMDKWFHCVVSCEMTRACGAVDAGLIADLHEIRFPGGAADTALDQQANRTGRQLGSDCRNKKSCEQACEDSGYRK